LKNILTMKLYKSIFVVASLMLFTIQCTVIDDSHLESPNALVPSDVDPDYLLNNIQLEARSIFRDAASIGAEMTRMTYMFGSTYENAFSPDELSTTRMYQNAYADLFADVQNLMPIVNEKGFLYHKAIANTLKANALLTLVDVFGDMPYSEANDATNFNPKLDGGANIYDSAIVLLDAAIADFAKAVEDGAPTPPTDFFYGGDGSRWTKAANTMKLKAYINAGNVAEVNDLIADPDANLIVDSSEDFVFRYSTTDVNPDSRHPNYANNYITSQGASSYMSLGYMNMMRTDKDIVDPRIRYYFYRQVTEDPVDFNKNSCINAFAPAHFDADDPFCLIGDGYWGRDHLIDDGIPPDGNERTTFGAYPVGGRFDDNSAQEADRGDGDGGAGIDPILMSAYTHFMIAEAQLIMNNDAGAAKTFLESALDESFGTVAGFTAQDDGSPFEASQDQIDAYKTEALADFDATGLRTIMKEYYFALWGNGYEAWNAMRRTGYPDRDDNLQPARTSNPGNWYRSVLYPSDMVERNSNIDQKAAAEVLNGPFWDTNSGDTKFNF
jgi:hypothetical protein